jgi:hypothetical protein
MQMFDLDDAELHQSSFLDCASGASTFGAQMRLRGGTVLSVDPVHNEGAEAIRRRVETNLAGARSWLVQQDDAINWDYLGSPDAYVGASTAGLDLFTYEFRGPSLPLRRRRATAASLARQRRRHRIVRELPLRLQRTVWTRVGLELLSRAQLRPAWHGVWRRLRPSRLRPY